MPWSWRPEGSAQAPCAVCRACSVSLAVFSVWLQPECGLWLVSMTRVRPLQEHCKLQPLLYRVRLPKRGGLHYFLGRQRGCIVLHPCVHLLRLKCKVSITPTPRKTQSLHTSAERPLPPLVNPKGSPPRIPGSALQKTIGLSRAQPPWPWRLSRR